MADTELKRANKITAYWGGDGVAIGIFYKTHEKIASIKSTDEAVTKAGFTMPVGDDVTAAQKLEAFKTFLSTNSTVFGVTFDPVDRRADAFKFPGHYDEKSFGEYSKKILTDTIAPLLKSMQDNTVTKMIAKGEVPANTAIQYGLSDTPEVTITEKYNNGNIKYATAKYDIAFAVEDKQIRIPAKVEIVSGQLKKPRTLGDNNDVVITITGLKNLFVENGLLPKPVPAAPKVEKSADAESAHAEGQTPDPALATTEAEAKA